MTGSSASPLGAWQPGIHPHAEGMRIRSLRRVELPIGEGFRLEMADPEGGDDLVHVQFVIDTDAGPWALWLTCPRDEAARNEALLGEIAPFSIGEPQDRPPTFHPDRPPFAPWDQG